MLKVQPGFNDSGQFHNFRCGEVFCIGPATYHVCCALCGQKILYQFFPQHFRLEHLSQPEECKVFNKHGKVVKSGQHVETNVKVEDDPIGYGDNVEFANVDLAQIALLDVDEVEDETTTAATQERVESKLETVAKLETKPKSTFNRKSDNKQHSSTPACTTRSKLKQAAAAEKIIQAVEDKAARPIRQRRRIDYVAAASTETVKDTIAVKNSTADTKTESIQPKVPPVAITVTKKESNLTEKQEPTEFGDLDFDWGRQEEEEVVEEDDNTNSNTNDFNDDVNINENDPNADDDGDDDDDDDDNMDSNEASNETTKPNPTLDMQFPCEKCERRYNSKRSLQYHIRKKHPPINTTDTNQTTATTAATAANTGKTKKEYKCEDCDKVFRNERELRGHRWKHTGIFCDICHKPFSQTGNMVRHRVRHTGIKAFKCTECDASFYTNKELTSHKICHTGRMPMICEICGRPCRDRGVLTAHMRRHTGERPAKCDVCGKCFYSFHDLSVHAVAHTSARPFVCDICGATFQRKKALRVHKLLHSDKRKYVCKICGKAFAQSGGLNAHLRIHDAAAIKAAAAVASQTAEVPCIINRVGGTGIGDVIAVTDVIDVAAAEQQPVVITNNGIMPGGDQVNVAVDVGTGEVTISMMTVEAVEEIPWESE